MGFSSRLAVNIKILVDQKLYHRFSDICIHSYVKKGKKYWNTTRKDTNSIET